jgi:hypothetical protein
MGTITCSALSCPGRIVLRAALLTLLCCMYSVPATAAPVSADAALAAQFPMPARRGLSFAPSEDQPAARMAVIRSLRGDEQAARSQPPIVLGAPPSLTVVPAAADYAVAAADRLDVSAPPRAVPAPVPGSAGQGLVDNWELLSYTGFESVVPASGCRRIESGSRHTWTDSGFRVYRKPAAGPSLPTADHLPTDAYAMVGDPSSAGPGAVDATVAGLPQDAVWLICGPFDLHRAATLMARFSMMLAAPIAEGPSGPAPLFFGASADGSRFAGWSISGQSDWRTVDAYFTGAQGLPAVWLGWAVAGDGSGDGAARAWIDGLAIRRYMTPAQPCGGRDDGAKGVNVPPYEIVDGAEHPIIRPGDTALVVGLAASGARWVRMVVTAKNGVVDLPDYDRMVDTLCARGISVLGVLNQETLARQDFNEGGSEEAYRAEFAAEAGALASYFQGRIGVWEVWNEENLTRDTVAGLTPPWVPPDRYARLLDASYRSVKTAAPEARLLMGGLASAWNDAYAYLAAVYWELDGPLAGARPFDALAIHPYFSARLSPDPAVYLHADPSAATILDKFAALMAQHGDGDKRIWVTEIGWNSARGHADAACQAGSMVSEADQAVYLKRAFDILFDEVRMPDAARTPAVAKIFWYQVYDVGLPAAIACPARAAAQPKGKAQLAHPAPLNPVPWWYGLYHGDKQAPKLTLCAFAVYPAACSSILTPIAGAGG